MGTRAPDGLSGADPRFSTLVLLKTGAVGGVWCCTIDLARGFSERGVEPVVAALGPAAVRAQRDEAAEIFGFRHTATI